MLCCSLSPWQGRAHKLRRHSDCVLGPNLNPPGALTSIIGGTSGLAIMGQPYSMAQLMADCFADVPAGTWQCVST